MSTPNIQAILADVNFWVDYREGQNAVHRVLEDVQVSYRRIDYSEPLPAQLKGKTPQYSSLGYGQPLVRPLAKESVASHRRFLDRDMPQLAEDPAQSPHWKGTKFLGNGTYGMVGLWEYNQRNDPDAPILGGPRQIAVKELILGPDSHSSDLHREAANFEALAPGGSPHIVTMIRNPGLITPEDEDEDLGPEWNNVIRRLFLEYCSLGSLEDLIERRRRLAVPFSELTLWRTFDCLIDGICALEYGNELKSNLATRSFVPDLLPDFIPIVHFDLKPANVLLADRRTIHPVHPMCKLADLGSAVGIRQPQDRDMAHVYESFRRRGTTGYLAPEQFTERWDYADWQDTGVAGVYGAATNVWGIGCIMYQLAVLTPDPPSHKDPFVPLYSLNGHPPKGITYGVNLRAPNNNEESYSEGLLHMIRECLYEKPGHRPGLVQLKKEVQDGMEIAIASDPTTEPWVDFLPAEPIPPAIASPPALPAQKPERRKAQRKRRRRANQDAAQQALPKNKRVFTQRCRHLDANDKQCGNVFNTSEGEEIYCDKHRGGIDSDDSDE